MYMFDRSVCVLFFISSFSLFLNVDVCLTESLAGNFVTIFSILLGFYMTSLSVLYGSSYTKRLYKTVDVKIDTQTLLHTLCSYFKYSVSISFISLILVVIIQAISNANNVGVLEIILSPYSINICGLVVNINVASLLNSLLFSIIIVSFYLAARLFAILIVGFVEESKL